MHGAGNFRIRREQAQVGIDARRGGIVVAGSDVGVAAHAIGIAAHEQRQLAMRLQADQSVKDLHAGVFHFARPANVVGFVKARFQFDHRRDFLARSRIHERRDDQRSARWCGRESA